NGDEAGDGAGRWAKTLLLMEYKAGQLTTRQRYAGAKADTLKGIQDLLMRGDGGKGRGKKGTGQLARNVARLLRGERVTSSGTDATDLCGDREIIPAIVLFEEALANEAVRRRADAHFRQELPAAGLATEQVQRVRPLMVLDVSDVELLECASGSYSVEE